LANAELNLNTIIHEICERKWKHEVLKKNLKPSSTRRIVTQLTEASKLVYKPHYKSVNPDFTFEAVPPAAEQFPKKV
jgi:hypothetical protein